MDALIFNLICPPPEFNLIAKPEPKASQVHKASKVIRYRQVCNGRRCVLVPYEVWE